MLAVIGCGSSPRNLGAESGAGDAGETSEAGAGGEAGSGGGHAGASGGKAGAGADSGGGGTSGGADTGGAGSAGMSGSTPVMGCKLDKDCDDGLACNGAEKCVNQVCAAGTAACANPDATNCDVVCTENGAAPTCAVKGKDADNDLHFSKACAANPGDDCDDMANSVYLGAQELCDGLDNDCDGKVDVGDGVPLGGTTAVITGGESHPAIAWAPEQSVYGIAYLIDNEGYFQTVNASGAIVTQPTDVQTGNQNLYGGLGWAWGGDSFGAAWSWDDGGGSHFRTVSATGGLGVTRTIIDAHVQAFPSVARVSGGNWAVILGYPPNLQGVTVSATGTVGSPVTLDPAFNDVSGVVASSGSSFAAAWKGTDQKAVAYLYNSTLGAPAAFTLAGDSPVVGSSPSGFAFATANTAAMTAPQFYSFNASGSAICGPVTLADATFVPAAITATPTGYLVASSGKVRVQEVLANCTMGQLFTVDNGPNDQDVGISGGASGYGVVWSNFTNGSVVSRRLFGPKYCN